jgi:hypothetical protein
MRRSGGTPASLDHTVLHLDGAAHRVDHAAKFDDGPIASALDDPPVVNGDYGVDQITPKRPQPRQDAILVRARKSAVADHIRHQDRRELSILDHGFAPSPEVD